MGPKIAIIGGGIGGLTAAVALARKGVAAEVYEQAPVLEEVGAGVGLWPNALTALAPIELAGKVTQLAVKLAGQGIKRPDGTWLLCIPGEVMAQRWGAGFVLVHRAEFQQLLAAELGPSVIHLGARCTGFEDSGQAVTAHFADGRKVQARCPGRGRWRALGRASPAVRARRASLPRLYRSAVYYARGISSAAPRRDRDLGAGCALRPGTHQRRKDHLVRDVECGGRRTRCR